MQTQRSMSMPKDHAQNEGDEHPEGNVEHTYDRWYISRGRGSTVIGHWLKDSCDIQEGATL